MQLGTDPTKQGSTKKEIPPAGMHLGILYRVVDAGWCESEYQGQKKMRTEGRLDFEIWPLNDKNEYVTMSDGRPFSVAPGFQGWLTFKKMGDVLLAWKGQTAIDSELILGQPALLNIVHKPYTNSKGEAVVAANVMNVLPVIPGMALHEMANPPCVYSVREHDLDVFNKLPKWIQDHIILKSADWQKVPLNLRPGVAQSHNDPGPSEPCGAPSREEPPF
jgi:hypothetical protein